MKYRELNLQVFSFKGFERIRKSKAYKDWRTAVFERDNYKCVLCGKGRTICADHIKEFALYPELRLNVDNGRTLCLDCHKKTPGYGWNFFNRNRTTI